MFKPLVDTYSYSLDEETFKGSFESREAAYTAAFKANTDVDLVYTAIQKPYEPQYEYAAEMIIEHLVDEASDNDVDLGQWYISSKLEEAVMQAIKQAIETAAIIPSFYTDIIEHDRPE